MGSIIAERMRLLRESKGLTGDAVARRAGVKASTISLLENEERTDPYSSTLVKLAQGLETTTDYLVGLSDCPTNNKCKPEGDSELQDILLAWPFLPDEGRRVLAEMSELLSKRRQQLLKL